MPLLTVNITLSILFDSIQLTSLISGLTTFIILGITEKYKSDFKNENSIDI